MESRFATSCPELATNSWKTLGRHLTPLELSLHGAAGEMLCFSPTNLTLMHTRNIFINASNLGSLGRNSSGMFCFVSFATAAFTPRILLLHSFYFSQDFRMSKALALNYTEMFIKQNDSIFNVLSTITLYSLQVGKWWCWRYLQI